MVPRTASLAEDLPSITPQWEDLRFKDHTVSSLSIPH